MVGGGERDRQWRRAWRQGVRDATPSLSGARPDLSSPVLNEAKEKPRSHGILPRIEATTPLRQRLTLSTRRAGFVDAGVPIAVQLIFNYCNLCKISRL